LVHEKQLAFLDLDHALELDPPLRAEFSFPSQQPTPRRIVFHGRNAFRGKWDCSDGKTDQDQEYDQDQENTDP